MKMDPAKDCTIYALYVHCDAWSYVFSHSKHNIGYVKKVHILSYSRVIE